MEQQAKCKLCGNDFIKRHPNHNYCSEKCRKEVKRRNEYKRTHRGAVAAPNLTINDMVKAMLRLSKERGHTVQYGELQSDLMTGKVKVRGGKIV